MRKILATLMIVVFSVACLSACSASTSPEAVSQGGLSVAGEGEYEWTAVSDYESALYIYSDGITVSGTAECDTLILMDENAKCINLDNLSQGDYRIHVMMNMEKDCELEYKGVNSVYVIEGSDKLKISGESSESELTVTGKIDAFSDMNISNGKVFSAYINSYQDIFIDGNTCIYLEPTVHEYDLNDNFISRISADGKVTIDVSETGIVKVDRNRAAYAVAAPGGLELAVGNVIEYPENGRADYSSREGIYTILQEGKVAKNITIRGQ